MARQETLLWDSNFLDKTNLIIRIRNKPYSLLGEFAKNRKVTTNFVMSVCLVAQNNSIPTGRIFMTFDVWVFSKIFPNFQVTLKLDTHNRYFTSRPIYIFMIVAPSIILRMRNTSDKSCGENQNTHFTLDFFFFENHAVYVIMWKNQVELAGHKWQNGACALHAGYLRLQTHTHNM